MRRTDGDTWDLATSVGATATMVAAARAVAARRPDSVVRDPFAGPLVDASGIEFFARLAAGQLDFGSVGGEVKTGWMPEVFAVRAKFFDEFFAGASSRGIRQIVIVAAGLDARSYRLAWPAATTVYEIDQPEVIEFKRRTLAASGAVPAADCAVWGSISEWTGRQPCNGRGLIVSSPRRGLLRDCSLATFPTTRRAG
jgi:methyltransferase (TIGR00027 family)